MSVKRAVMMHASDNVATAIEEILPGEEVVARIGQTAITVTAADTVPFGFKIALGEIAAGDVVRKYGESIGKASVTILKGAMVHVHNLEGTRARGDLV